MRVRTKSYKLEMKKLAPLVLGPNSASGSGRRVRVGPQACSKPRGPASPETGLPLPPAFCSASYYKKHRSPELIGDSLESSEMLGLLSQSQAWSRDFGRKASLPVCKEPAVVRSTLPEPKERLKRWLLKVDGISEQFRRRDRGYLRGLKPPSKKAVLRISPEVLAHLLGPRR